MAKSGMFSTVLVMVCIMGGFFSMPKERALADVITKTAVAYKNRGI